MVGVRLIVSLASTLNRSIIPTMNQTTNPAPFQPKHRLPTAAERARGTERMSFIAEIANKGKTRAVLVASLPLPADEVAVVLPSEREQENVDEETINIPSAALVSQLADTERLVSAHESAAHASSDLLTKAERIQAARELAEYRAERQRYWLAPLSLFRPLFAA